ncbi:serine/threonine kinase-like domain-containing protein STKLD1 [Heptranchias perlo]|uniref:serine/threonine kinase-like domain-containing protein STKLD1 n=1 Tax=Heptranchias perlo TaxID=212740 RepID=UPI00355A6919
MENYEILSTSPKGAYGFVHTVKHLRDNKTYAMKKIECMDEATCNKAVREAMALLDLQHSTICKYKEIFVTWDEEVSALCVCMVMDYSNVGDVALVLRDKRRRREKVREMVIKNFLGQMVDVLVYIHSKNVFHGNLKPSNILLLVDLSFAICDFTVPTFVNDEINHKIRMKDHLKIWMAPEAMEGKATATSDIWSTACIMLEMMVCSKMDENEFDQLVKRIRNDQVLLQTILEKLHDEQKYTSSLCDLLKTMMETNPQDRISAEALVDLQYVKESLVICGSPLSGMKRSPVGPLIVPYGEGIDKLLEYMQVQVEVEEAQKSSLKYLNYLMYETEVLLASTRIVPVLISVLKCHSDCLEVQAQACRILLKFATKATEDSVEEGFLFSDRVVDVILSIMESRRKCVELQIIICNLLMLLSGSVAAGKLIGKAGGIQSILKTLRMYRDNSHICIPCCGALYSLVVSQRNAQTAVSEGSLETIQKVLEKHLTNGDVVESSCSALWALCLEE